MPANFQSSFIPKGPVTEEVFKKKKAGMLGILSVSLFIASIIISAALYAYKDILKGDIQNLQADLASAEKTIDKDTIKQLSEFSEKLKVAKSIVASHSVSSGFLEELASSTVSSIQFTSLNYESAKQGVLSANLSGKASSYASVALQEDVLSKNENFQSVSFSNLSLNDKGEVSFDMEIIINPKITAYSSQ